jgi:opacity protein-like surface antigen
MRHLLLAASLCVFVSPALAADVVAVAPFTGIGLEGGGEIVVKYGKVQKVTLIKGSTQYTTFKVEHGGGLDIRACNSSCPHNYDLKIEIETPNLNALAISGGGEIHTAGSFPAQGALDAAVHGGGEIDATAIAAKDVNAAVNGGGEIAVTATATLRAAVNGGGEISYHGNPSVTSAVSGGGSVERAN